MTDFDDGMITRYPVYVPANAHQEAIAWAGLGILLFIWRKIPASKLVSKI